MFIKSWLFKTTNRPIRWKWDKRDIIQRNTVSWMKIKINHLLKVFFLFRSHVLQKVCMYFTYKVRYTNSSTEIPEFPIAPEIALELLMAANFLDC